MRNLKKFLALVLAFMMAMSLMVTANAAVTENKEFSDSNTVEKLFEEDLLVVNGMGIIQGYEDGTFGPQRNVTRGQMAAIVYRLATGDASDARNNIYSKYNKFSDVQDSDWFAGYIGYCADAGYIVGYPDGSFKPHASVTGYQALTMILRAMGYKEPGHNFEGSTWKAETSSTATQRGMLVNINNTNYRDTLNLPATRELVAEMAFQGATKEMVQWTNAYGYQTTGMQTGTPGAGSKNPSLGLLYYGLTCNKGVVVGNEATGEGKGVTKIGFSLDSKTSSTQLISNAGGGVLAYNQTAFTTEIDDSLTVREGKDKDDGSTGNRSAYVYESDEASVLPGNVTRSFKWDSDLYLFNHAVTVWYDNRSNETVKVGNTVNGNATFTTNLNTYAVFDEVTNVAVVSVDDQSLAAGGALRAEAVKSQPWQADVTNNWKAPGFAVRESGAYWNYAFGRNFSTAYGTSGASYKSPVLDNGETSEHQLYLLISNSPNKALDVVISLDMTMTQIVQSNNTTYPYSVGVTTANGGHQYFGVTADNGKVNAGAGSTTTYTSLAQANLVKSPKLDLGTKVAAIEITGTNGLHTPAGNPGDATAGWATARSPLTSNYYYQLTENTLKKTSTVIKVDYGTQAVTLSDGTVLNQSIFAEDTDATFTTRIEGSSNTAQAANILQAGKDYTFTLDEQGNYIYWELPTNTAKFVYGTYIDFETKTASSEFIYPLVYVGTDGKMGQENVTAVGDANNQSTPGTAEALRTAANPLPMSYDTYNKIGLNKRDASGAGLSTAGYLKNQYIGYALDSNGVLRAVDTSDSQNTGFLQATTANFGTSSKITINSTDVAITAKAVDDANKLYITNNTQFYLVDGAGTDNQKVTPYLGLAELMEGMDEVVIDANTALSSCKYLANNTTPYKMVYYYADSFNYAQSYEDSAQEVKTVFIPKECVTFTPSVDTSLVFVGDNSSKLVSSVGGHATLFTMYKNGVEGDYWIEGWQTVDANSAADIVGTGANINVFYSLMNTGRTAADGQPIYTIRKVGNTPNDRIIGKYFDANANGFTAAGLTTFAATTVTDTTNPGSGKTAGYYATTYQSQVAYICDTAAVDTAKLYNVGGATVKNLDEGTYPGIKDSQTDLNNASSLVNNVGVPVSCILGDNNRTVSVIYVNYAP